MGQNATNIIDFTARKAASQPRPLREVESYWEALRDGRLVPERADMDPRGFSGALSHSFLLEKIAPGLARIRLAGRHLSDLMGIDVQGMPFTTLFLPEARPAMIETMSAVFDEPGIARLKLSSSGGVGREALEAQLILLPLRDDLGDITRALGCLVAEGRIGRTPRRFGLVEAQRQTLIGYGRRPDALRNAPAPLPTPGGPMGEVIDLGQWRD